MKTVDISKYPLTGEVFDHADGKESCPYLKCYCSTCMYRAVADDAWKTGDYRDRCLYAAKEDLA